MPKVKKAGKKVKKFVVIGQEKYDAAIFKVRSKKWSGPLGKTMSFTGHVLNFAGKSGAPFVGMLGSALVVGSKVLNPDPTLADIVESKDIIKAQVEIGFNHVSDKLDAIQNQLEDLRKTAQKTLSLMAEMKWKDGLKRVQAYCKNVFVKKNLLDIYKRWKSFRSTYKLSLRKIS